MNSKNWTLILITVLIVLTALLFLKKKTERPWNLKLENKYKYAYILTTDLKIQKVNYLFPFSPASSQKTIRIETEEGQEIKNFAPNQIFYLVRQQDDDYLAVTSNNQSYSLVLGDGEVSFWPIFEGLEPPIDIDIHKILAVGWTADGIDAAQKNKRVAETLKKIKITEAKKSENLEQNPSQQEF